MSFRSLFPLMVVDFVIVVTFFLHIFQLSFATSLRKMQRVAEMCQDFPKK